MDNNSSPIRIKNLFYMLCYAWNVLPIADDIKVDYDTYDDAYNLLAYVFSFGIGKLIRSGFHRSYIDVSDELPTVKGKINIQQSINNMSLQSKKLYCDFDEYSDNDMFNQIIKYTIELILKSPQINNSIKKQLKKQIVYFDNICCTPPTRDVIKKLVFNQNSITYRLLINISVMIYTNSSLNEESGNKVFKDFYRQNQMEKVFEKFLLNFYSMHLDKSIYHVHAPKINWHIDEDLTLMWEGIFDVVGSPGDRRTDIVVENNIKKTQIIMDAKYYENTFIKAYMSSDDEKIRTSHLNQIRGYIIDSDYEGEKIGVLVYPMVNYDLTNGVMFPIQGTPIIVKTVNLNDDWQNIENDLLSFIYKFEHVKK